MKHQDNSIQSRQLDSLVEDALQEFWGLIAEQYPQATSGDLSPLRCIRLHIAARDAVEEWVWANVSSTAKQ